MIKMYSSTKGKWYLFTAKFDTGTPKNWISSDVVNLLRLSIQKVPSKKYTTFNGEELQSNEMVMDILWCGEGSPQSRETDFRIAYKAPFDVLFGSELLSSQQILSFNESALILTSKKETEGSSCHLTKTSLLRGHRG